MFIKEKQNLTYKQYSTHHHSTFTLTRRCQLCKVKILFERTLYLNHDREYAQDRQEISNVTHSYIFSSFQNNHHHQFGDNIMNDQNDDDMIHNIVQK